MGVLSLGGRGEGSGEGGHPKALIEMLKPTGPLLGPEMQGPEAERGGGGKLKEASLPEG